MLKTKFFAKSLLLGAALLTTTSAFAASIKSVTPTPDELEGAPVEEIASITIKFSEWVYDWGSKSDYYFQYNETDPATLLPVELNYTSDFTGVVITPKAGTQTADGWYYLYIPGGTIELESGFYEEEIEFMWQVKGSAPQPSTMWVTPVSGNTVVELSYFYVNFDKTWADGDTSKKITVTGPEGVTIPELVETKETKDVKITFAGDAKITEAGTYTLTVPAGRFKLGDYEGAPDNEELVATYNVVDPAKALKVDPAPGEVTQLSEWTLTGFASANKNTKGIKVEGPEGVTLPTLKNTASGSGKWSIYFDNEEVVTEPGKYTLYIPADKFYIDDDWTFSIPAQTFEYIIPASPYTGTVSVNPEQGVVETLDQVELTFDDAAAVIVDKPDDIVFTTPEGAGNVKGTSVSGNKLTVILGENTAAGTYSLKLPEAVLKIDKLVNEELVYTWTIEAQSITLNKTSLVMKVGEAETLVATVEPEATPENPVTWTSSDETVATVDQNGKVTGVGVGTATITAYYRNVSATCEVTVNPVPAEIVTLNLESVSMAEGETVKLVATVYPEETTVKTIEWTSSNEVIASVDNEGTVSALSEGFAWITATCGEASASCYVTVVGESGIENINADVNGRYIIWNLQGVKVLDTNNVKDLKTLPQGLYIVNDKKVLVK